MKVFFDTEFTGLSSDPRLLSIGLVAEDGREMYVELTDGWSEAMCSPWVRQHVLPMLGRGARLTRRETGRRINEWLTSFNSPTTLVGDTDWDTTLLGDLMNECGIDSSSYRIELISYANKAEAMAFEGAKREYFNNEKALPHHALDDARAFRGAWEAVLAPSEQYASICDTK